MITLTLNPSSIADYNLLLQAKRLPSYQIQGRTISFPERYAAQLGLSIPQQTTATYSPWPGLWDYQRDIARMAIEREKFAVFADCGFGKTFIMLEIARHVASVMDTGQCVLMIEPLNVIDQTVDEARKFYGESLPVKVVPSAKLANWLTSGTEAIGITNWDAILPDLPQGRLAALLPNESSMLKSHYGVHGQACIQLGRGLRWKAAFTGTPAPNDRIEYANHAVLLDAFPTINSFLARFFINKGQTDNRWELKPHALRPFYRALSDWCIFLSNPATYGWRDNTAPLPPINIHIHDVDLTTEQDEAARNLTGMLFPMNPGGITTRSKFAQIAKGHHNGEKVDTLKPAFIRGLVESWPDESTIIWCRFNPEQDQLAKMFPGAANISGATPIHERRELIADFKAGRRKILLSKARVLGYGLNLEVATRMIFSSCHDSYEEFYQAVKRANRYGATRPLNVHLPCTEIERPMLENVLRKAARVQEDTNEQEALFRELAIAG